MHHRRADLVLILITVIWGSTFIVVKTSLDMVGPFVLVAARFWVAGLALLVVFALRRPARAPGLLRDGAVTGLFLTAGFVTQTIGLQTTEASKTAFITGLSVVLVPLFAAVRLRRPPARSTVASVILATVGLGLLTLDRSLRFTPGDLWVLACAAAFALHILATGRFAPRHAVLPFTLVQVITVAVLASLAALVLEQGALLPPTDALPTILYLSVIGTAFVFGAQTWSQRHTTPTRTAIIFSLEPVCAALFAAIFAGELLTPKEWLGGALILVGTVLAELGGPHQT